MAITNTGNAKFTGSTGQVASVAYPNALAANSLLIVCVEWSDGPATPPMVSGTQNGSFGSAIEEYYDSNGLAGLAIYALVNRKGAVSETINISYSSGSDYCGVIIDEFTGCATSSPSDGAAYQDQSSLTSGTNVISSGSFTPPSGLSGDLIYAVTTGYNNSSMVQGMSAGTSANFTAGVVMGYQSSMDGMFANEYLVQGSAGSIAGTFSLTQQSGYPLGCITFCAAFKAATGGSSLNMVQEEFWFGRTAYTA
jgi:hypothetical protein